jgi:hypothetical protein
VSRNVSGKAIRRWTQLFRPSTISPAFSEIATSPKIRSEAALWKMLL